MRKYIPMIVLAALLPVIASAQATDALSLWSYLMRLIIRVTQLFWILTIFTFLWGLVNFMRKADVEKERANARQMMIGSVVAFFLAVSFWGLVTFAIKSFNLTPDAGKDQLPYVQAN